MDKKTLKTVLIELKMIHGKMVLGKYHNGVYDINWLVHRINEIVDELNGIKMVTVDSNALNSLLQLVCADCGKEALLLPLNQFKKQLSISTYHKAQCDVCGQIKSVTEVRNFGYPIFNVKKDVYKKIKAQFRRKD